MAYFIHNKYDKDSKAKVTLVSGTNYTYKADNTVTVIDYFGLLESGVKTYQYLDTAYMGIQTVASLVYTTIDMANLIGKTPTTDGKSIIEFATGVINILEKLQILVGEKSDTGGGVSDGTIMAKLNSLSSALTSKSIIKKIQRGITNSSITGSNNDGILVTLSEEVDMNKSIVICNGMGDSGYCEDGSTKNTSFFPNAVLESSSTLRVRGGSFLSYDSSKSSRSTWYINVAWQVIEFY